MNLNRKEKSRRPHSYHINTQEELERVLAQERAVRDLRFLANRREKWKVLLLGGIIGSCFISLMPTIIIWDFGSFRWWALLSLPGILWTLFIGLAHRSISWETFKKMSPEEKEIRYLYESFWMRLWQGGFGVYVSLILLLGSILFAYWGQHDLPGHRQLLAWGLGLGYGLVMGALWRRRWAWILILEKKGSARSLFWRIAFTVLSLALLTLLLSPGIYRWMEVLLGKERADTVMSPIFLAVTWLLAIGVGFFSLLGLVIAVTQYRVWREKTPRLHSG